jgi:hypothetical protein
MPGKPSKRRDVGGRSDGATWCEQHNRRECAKNTKKGVRCHQIALDGLDACPLHAGESRAKAKARGQANLMKAAFAESIPAAEFIDPGEALLWTVTVSSRQVAWLRGLISDRLNVAGTRVDDDALSVLVKIEQDERVALARAAKMALDAGIAERQIRMAERVAEQLVSVLRGVVTELGHDPADPAVAGVCRRHLTLVSGAA